MGDSFRLSLGSCAAILALSSQERRCLSLNPLNFLRLYSRSFFFFEKTCRACPRAPFYVRFWPSWPVMFFMSVAWMSVSLLKLTAGLSIGRAEFFCPAFLKRKREPG